MARKKEKKLEQDEKSKDKDKKKKKGGVGNVLLTLGICVCVGVMGYSIYRLASAALEYKEGEDEYDDLKQYTTLVADTQETDGGTEGTVTDPSALTAETVTATPPLTVDFASLQAINPDIVGWLYVEALDISYPVVHGTDNDYYLHRTFEGKDNFAGTLFVEYRNGREFKDPNTIIYGHNMKNQSMFGKLKFLKEQNKYADSPYFWILTPDYNYRYEIFSMQVTEADGEVYTLFTNPGDEFVEYLTKRQKESEVQCADVSFNKDSRIVTLSTCTSDEIQRFVVQGLLISR